MKKSIKLLPLAVLMLTMVSCSPTTSDSTTPSQTTSSEPASSESSSPSTSSQTPTSSSQKESETTSSVTPSESESTDTKQAVTQTVDIASLPAHNKNDVWETNNGFFKFSQIKTEAGKTIKTDQTSDVSASKGVIKFTTTGAGKISLAANSPTDNTARRLFIAKLTSDDIGEGATYEYIHEKVFNKTKTYTEAEFELYEAGTYLILSAAGININALSVTYTEGTTSTMPTYTPALTEASRLSLLDIRPGTYTNTKVSDNYTINGEVTYKGDRKIEGTTKDIKLFNDCLSASSGTVAVKFTAPSEGTLSIWAIENEKTGTVKLGHKLSTETNYTYSDTYLKSEIIKDASKTPEAITFSVSQGSTYDITCDTGSMSIFLIEFSSL